MNRIKRLRSVAKDTEFFLQESANKLLRWATLIQAYTMFAPIVTPKEIRELADFLAKQSGRLSMAVEMSLSPKERK